MMRVNSLNPLKFNLTSFDPRGLALTKRQPGSSLLGLALDGHRIEGAVIKRSNGSVRVQNAFSASLELNLLTSDPALAGREIRNQLERAGARERNCAVCLPLDWALTAHVPIPELPEEDVRSFLEIEAERSFPFGPETLSIMTSRCRGKDGTQFATLVAVPKENLFTLQKVLKAAQLRPTSFSLGLTAMQRISDSPDEGVAALRVGESHVELQVTCGGGIAALRTLQGALEEAGVRKQPYVDVVSRDLRITLGQLPAGLRQEVRRVRVFGSGDEMERFAEELASRTKPMGLEVQLVRSFTKGDLGVEVPADAGTSPGVSLATRLLSAQGAGLEFLPPKVSAWKQFSGKYSSRKLAWTGGALGGLILLVAAAFAVQQWQLGRWRTTWTRMKPQVNELETMQQQIRHFRPWFDESFRSLNILRTLTEAFPEDGSVSASRIEIRDPGIVSCSGTARDQQSVFKVRDRLRASKDITSVEFDHIRGKQFTLSLRWGEGGAQ